MLAERAFFYVKRMPLILNWQIQDVVMFTLAQPETQQIVEAGARLAEAVERLNTVAEDLSEQLPQERAAAIDQIAARVSEERNEILRIFEQEEAPLRGLLKDLRLTIDAATALSTSLNTTVESTDRLKASFATSPPSDVEKQPFDVAEYQATAEAATVTAEAINQLLLSVQELLASPIWEERRSQISDATDRTQAGLEQLIDRGYRRGLVLIGVLIVGGLAAALVYRVLAARLVGPRIERASHAPR